MTEQVNHIRTPEPSECTDTQIKKAIRRALTVYGCPNCGHEWIDESPASGYGGLWTVECPECNEESAV